VKCKNILGGYAYGYMILVY